MPQERDAGRKVAQRNKGCRALVRVGVELEGRCGNDAQRTLRANKQLFEIIPGIVLPKAVQIGQQIASRHHGLKAQHLISCVAVTQNVYTACIGREVAADLATAFRRQTKREKTPGFERCGLKFCQDTPRLDRHRIVGRIDVANLFEPLETEDDLVGVRHSAATEPGVAALRHHRRFVRDAGPHHCLDLSSMPGPNNDLRSTVKPAAPLL